MWFGHTWTSGSLRFYDIMTFCKMLRAGKSVTRALMTHAIGSPSFTVCLSSLPLAWWLTLEDRVNLTIFLMVKGGMRIFASIHLNASLSSPQITNKAAYLSSLSNHVNLNLFNVFSMYFRSTRWEWNAFVKQSKILLQKLMGKGVPWREQVRRNIFFRWISLSGNCLLLLKETYPYFIPTTYKIYLTGIRAGKAAASFGDC